MSDLAATQTAALAQSVVFDPESIAGYNQDQRGEIAWTPDAANGSTCSASSGYATQMLVLTMGANAFAVLDAESE